MILISFLIFDNILFWIIVFTTYIPCSRKIWWKIKFNEFTVGDANVKLNPVNINID